MFRVDRANPTADKPQSKLWFARGTWWAWLPDGEGSSVWRRTSSGWRRQSALDEPLRGLPGRADVLADGDVVHAVLVDGRRLAVVTLQYFDDTDGYRLVGEPARFEAPGGEPGDTIETATIARDGRGCLWIAYPWQRRMWVRATLGPDRTEWTPPLAVSDPTGADDICALVALPGAVGLAWSNQSDDTMNFRLHRDGTEPGTWQPTEVIERGQRNADDHINAKVAADGTLLLATKNSVDRIGEPQLVLRVRKPAGGWQNLPYATRTTAHPSRPVMLLGGDPPCLLLLHTLYDRQGQQPDAPRRNTIAWQQVPLAQISPATLAAPSRPLIDPAAAVNNVSGCKANLPQGSPWIILASDAAGNIYEGHLDPNPRDQRTGGQEP